MLSAKWTFFLIPWFQRKWARFVVSDVNYFFILFLTHLGLWWSEADQDSSLYTFIFQVNFVTSDALWEKWMLAMLASFCVVMGKKEKCEHGASYARDGNSSLLNSMCVLVLNWNYQIIASECPREQGAAFAVAICFLKPALFQCCLKFVCLY